jgi:hypothetical protein
MAGMNGAVVAWPLYYRLGNESTFDIAGRFIDMVLRLAPELQRARVQGFEPLKRIANHAGAILTTLGFQITEMESLLTEPYLWKDRFTQAVQINPDIAPSVRFFITKGAGGYSPHRAETLLNQIALFTYDSSIKAIFGASVPGINWQEVIDKKQLVLLDFRDLEHRPEELVRFLTLWVFRSLISFIEQRGDTLTSPISVVIDEFATLMPSLSEAGELIWTDDLNKLLQRKMRHKNLWLTIAHQEMSRAQIPDAISDLLLGMGTQIIGRTDEINSALKLARQFFPIDPYKVKRYTERLQSDVIEHDEGGLIRGALVYPVEDPVDMSIADQHYEHAELLRSIEKLSFLAKFPRKSQMYQFKIDTKENISYPDSDQIAQKRAVLHAKTARPITEIIAEIDKRTQPEGEIPASLPVRTRGKL